MMTVQLWVGIENTDTYSPSYKAEQEGPYWKQLQEGFHDD